MNAYKVTLNGKVYEFTIELINKDDIKAAPAPATAAPVAPATDDEQLIVAIATAAIAAERGESACAFKVLSITKLQ